jgi:hypothetical protein
LLAHAARRNREVAITVGACVVFAFTCNPPLVLVGFVCAPIIAVAALATDLLALYVAHRERRSPSGRVDFGVGDDTIEIARRVESPYRQVHSDRARIGSAAFAVERIGAFVAADVLLVVMIVTVSSPFYMLAARQCRLALAQGEAAAATYRTKNVRSHEGHRAHRRSLPASPPLSRAK